MKASRTKDSKGVVVLTTPLRLVDYPKINFFKFFKRQIINPSEKLDILKAFLVVYKPVNQVQDTQADAFFGALAG
jgi:hypothetical protein